MRRKGWSFNSGDCLIEMTAWTGLTVFADGNETLTINLVKIKINKKRSTLM
jgi:hypothetical protein